MYQYGSTKVPSLNDKFLYHFTSAESLMEILKTRTLKLSSFDSLNDLNEKEIKFVLQDWLFGFGIEEFIIRNCKLSSFSRNFEAENGLCECGCNHPRMWAQYADNNKGACIVINESKLIQHNKNYLDELFWKIENVSYNHCLTNEESNVSDNIPELFIKENYRTIFFEKYRDWHQEDERRFLCINGPDYLTINDCIEFICLGNKFENKNYENLSDIIISSVNNGLTPLIPDDFTFQLNAQGRSLSMDNVGRIISYIKNKRDKANGYINFLNENGYTI